MQFENRDGQFPTTQWSIVLTADAATIERGRASLETLCRRYWYPLYVYARRNGRTHHESEDCTQTFLGYLMANHRIAHANPERGKFRTFLLSAFQNFLTDEWRKAMSQRQGGDRTFESIEWHEADRRFSRQLEDAGVTPSQAFDRAWAIEMIGQAKHELRQEYQSTDRGDIFRVIEPILLEAPGSTSLASHAEKLGMSNHAFAMALSRARQRLGKLITDHVMDTVEDPSHAEGELRHLIEACHGLYNFM